MTTKPRGISFSIEAGLCALFALALGYSAYAILAVRNDAESQHDLGLRTLAIETRNALTGGERPLARIVPASWSTSAGTVSADSIAFDAGRSLPPSALRGGFIADQVAAYNRAQRRAAWRASVRPTGGAESVGHTGFINSGAIADAEGSRDIIVDPAALTVPSPFAERAWRTVLAHDSRRFNGILRAHDIMEPHRPEDLVRPEVRGVHWCTGVARARQHQTDVYCGSLTGLDIGRNAEISIRDATPGGDEKPTVSRGIARRLWRNGAEVSGAGAPLSAGDVLYTRTAGAMIPSNAVSGIIAGTSVVNGQRRFLVTEGPLRPMAIALARGSPTNTDPDSTILALHGTLTRELDSATSGFLRKHGNVERVEVVVVDGWSGGVRALAGRSQLGVLAYVPGFEPAFVGSLVKPIIATAILSEQPALARLTINAREGEMVNSVFGVTLRKPFNAGHTTGRIDLPTFLQTSNNKYAVELVFASLIATAKGEMVFDAEGNIPLEVLERSAIANGLLKVFDVQAGGDKSAERDPSVWWKPDASGELLPAMRAQTWYWPWASRPSLFVSRASTRGRADSLRGTDASTISRFAFGQGFNEWTLLGAAQAMTRVVTGRAVTVRMLDRAATDSFAPFAWRNAPWSSDIRKGLRAVAREAGTADGLEQQFSHAFGAREVEIFAKTGTAQTDDNDAQADRNALGMFIVAGPLQPTAPDCGLAVTLAVDYRNRPPLARSHRDFAEQVVAPLLARHWAELVTCRRASARRGVAP